MNPPAASSNSPGAIHSAPHPDSSEAATVALQALDRLLENVAELISNIDDDLYRNIEDRVFRSSPGGHIRHTLDHIQALIAGLDSEAGLICYDRRRRGTDVENDRGVCLTAIRGLRLRLGEWLQQATGDQDDPGNLPLQAGGFDPARLVQVEQIVTPDRDPILLESNALRELVFVFHHSIHHAASLAARLRSAGLAVPESFGVAPATLAANR
ncbi:MAG: hypothetical protein NXI24_11195 [bacterium]|nr:hypothetical protein [bacterium]